MTFFVYLLLPRRFCTPQTDSFALMYFLACSAPISNNLMNKQCHTEVNTPAHLPYPQVAFTALLQLPLYEASPASGPHPTVQLQVSDASFIIL